MSIFAGTEFYVKMASFKFPAEINSLRIFLAHVAIVM